MSKYIFDDDANKFYDAELGIFIDVENELNTLQDKLNKATECMKSVNNWIKACSYNNTEIDNCLEELGNE